LQEHAALVDRRTDDDKVLEWLEALPAGRAAQIRNQAGWSRKEVAAECGISSASLVGKWETTGSGWSRFTGLRYARLLRRLEAEALVNEKVRL
jgi:DNA-binding transcriptional regulator YiaG